MPELANPGDPLVRRVGNELVDDKGTRYVAVPSDGEAVRQITHTRRQLAELPDIPKNMSPIGVVVAYELFGLSDQDIAIATGLTVMQVRHIMDLEAYDAFKRSIVESIEEQEGDTVKAIFVEKAKTAALGIVETMGSPDRKIAFDAKKEVLDRSGNTVKQISEHVHKEEATLNIVYVNASSPDQMPTVDVDFKELTDAEQDAPTE